MPNNNNSQIVHKITLSWAVSECAIGGFLHALQSPFTGIIVGGLSVIFISLIAYYSDLKNITRTLAQSLIFVLGIKLAVSPHSPLGAYLAVSMQAGFGLQVIEENV